MLPLKYVYTYVVSLGDGDSISTDTAKTQSSYDTKDISSAFRLINVDHVQVLLLLHGGTFASMSNLSFSGKDKIPGSDVIRCGKIAVVDFSVLELADTVR